MRMQTYSFTTGVITLAGTDGYSDGITFTLSSDTDFQIYSICGGAIQSNVLVTNWAGRVQVQEEGKGSTWYNNPILFDAIAGNGRFPFMLEPPKRVPAKTSLIVTFIQEGTTVTDVELVFHGNKVFEV